MFTRTFKRMVYSFAVYMDFDDAFKFDVPLALSRIYLCDVGHAVRPPWAQLTLILRTPACWILDLLKSILLKDISE